MDEACSLSTELKREASLKPFTHIHCTCGLPRCYRKHLATAHMAENSTSGSSSEPLLFGHRFQAPGLPACSGRRAQLEGWILLAPALKQKQELPIGGGKGRDPNIRAYLSKERSFGAFQKLARCQFEEESQANDKMLFRIKADQQISTLESLPTELLDLIFEYLERPSKITLGLCSTLLWNTVVIHSRNELRSQLGCWAGSPLICAAQDSENLPESIGDILSESIDGEDSHNTSASRLARAIGSYQETESQDVSKSWQTALSDVLSREPVTPSLTSELTSSLATALHVPYTQIGEYWFLRILTAHEFIRLQCGKPLWPLKAAQPSGPSSPFLHVEDEPYFGLDKALLMQIARSSRSVGRSTIQGPWAGHSFDVVPSRAHDLEHDEWRDITEDIVQLAKKRGYLGAAPTGRPELTERERVMIESMGGSVR